MKIFKKLFNKHKHKREFWRIFYSDIRQVFVGSWICDCGKIGESDTSNFKELNLKKAQAKDAIKTPYHNILSESKKHN